MGQYDSFLTALRAEFGQHCGLIPPMLAEEMEEFTLRYPDLPIAWANEAVQVAVQARISTWAYVRGVLERWATQGRGWTPRRRMDYGKLERLIAHQRTQWHGENAKARDSPHQVKKE